MTKTGNEFTVSVNFHKKWLNPEETKKILACAKQRSLRDYLLILLSYRHGLRSLEATYLRYSWIDHKRSSIWIERVKGSISATHPLAKDEMKLIKRLQSNTIAKGKDTDYIFNIGTSRIRQICGEIANDTGIEEFHHHSLRHTCGYDMAVKGIDSLIIKNYLGHEKIQNTMVYVEGAGRQFNKLPRWYQE